MHFHRVFFRGGSWKNRPPPLTKERGVGNRSRAFRALRRECRRQRPPFQLQPITSVAGIEMMIRRRRGGQSDLVLHPVPQFVQQESGALLALRRQGEQKHRPLAARPIERGVGQVDVHGNLAPQDRTDPREATLRIRLVGIGDPGCGIDQEEAAA